MVHFSQWSSKFWVCFFCLKLHEELNLKQGLVPWSCETKEKEPMPHVAFLSSLFLPPIFFLFEWKSSSLNIGSSSTRREGYFKIFPIIVVIGGHGVLILIVVVFQWQRRKQGIRGGLTFCWHSFLCHLLVFSQNSTKKRKSRSIGLDFHK